MDDELVKRPSSRQKPAVDAIRRISAAVREMRRAGSTDEQIARFLQKEADDIRNGADFSGIAATC